MKALRTLATLAIGTITAIAMSGCGKTSNGNTASNPSSATCTVQTDGTVRNSAGALCNATTTTCPTAGWYRDGSGQQISCTPGQYVNINNNYPYTQNPGVGCGVWEQKYNTKYVPMLLDGQYVCVNYDWLNSHAGSSPYHNNYDYYYQYPPYQNNGQYECTKEVQIGVGNINGDFCF